MRTNLILICFAFVIAAASSSSRSQPADDTPVAAPAEPITGQPIDPAPGDETGPRDPFTQYETGGTEAAWSYESLGAEEKVVADRNRDVTGWKGVHDAYREAAIERAAQAVADAAAHRLGVDDLGTTGVVP